MADENINFGILQAPDAIKTSMGGSAPQAQTGPAASMGGMDNSGLEGIAQGLADLKAKYGSNPVSTASQAINDQMKAMPPQALAQGLLGNAQGQPNGSFQPLHGAAGQVQAMTGQVDPNATNGTNVATTSGLYPQGPQAAPGHTPVTQGIVDNLNHPQTPNPVTVPGQTPVSNGIIDKLNYPNGMLPPAKSKTGFDIENHALTDVKDPAVQGTAIHAAVTAASKPGATPMDVAQSYVGQGRKNHADVIEGFISKSTGGNVNIQNTPWCAAFANSVLASTGHGSTGSLAAQSFLKYGKETATPSNGDVVVMGRGGKDSGLGHVGFFAGYGDDHQTVKVLAGNTNGQVMTKEYPLNSVLGYRVPPNTQELQARANEPQLASNGPIVQPKQLYNDNNEGINPPNLSHEDYESISRDMDKGASLASNKGNAGISAYNPSTGRYA